MIPCSRIDIESHQVYLKSFENAPVGYVETVSKEDPEKYVSWAAFDGKKLHHVKIKENDLRVLGISISALRKLRHNHAGLEGFLQNTARYEELLERAGTKINSNYEYANFFQNPEDRAWINRVINGALVSGKKRTPKMDGIPRAYLSHGHVFVSLKGLACLGFGGHGKIKRSAWITNSLKNVIVAKKKFYEQENGNYIAYEREKQALEIFRNQVGIINMIAADNYEGKRAIFLPIYKCSVWKFLGERPFSLSMDESLQVMYQWLQGLATIATKGVHRDLSLGNLLINKKGPEGVIADLGAFCVYGQEAPGATAWDARAPEYFKGVVTSKLDVWGMGLAMQALVSKTPIPLFTVIETEDAGEGWIQTLGPNWSLEYPVKEDTPPFLVELINDMLNIDPEMRPSAAAVLERFSSGKTAYERQSSFASLS